MSVTIDPRVLVSWDGTGNFDGANDDVSGDVAADAGFTVEYGRDGAQALSPPKVAAGATTLMNDDGTYSQERGDSPVYQRVLPGRPVRYQITIDEAANQLWTGPQNWSDPIWWGAAGEFRFGEHVIDDISQSTRWGDRTVALDTLGYESVLTKAVVSINLLTQPLVSECVSLLLYEAGWPTEKRDISVSDTRLAYWWCDERHPWDALLELLAAEGPGAMWVDGQGVFHFENRNYKTTTTRSTTSQATLYDRDTGGLWFTDLAYQPNFRSVYNRATYSTRRRAVGDLATVWSYGTDLALSAGQTVTLIARPQDPFLNAVTPVSGTDFTATGGTVSVLLNATSGTVAYLTISAIGASATISNLQLRAQPLTVVSETTVSNTIDASESIAKYSPVAGQDVPITLDVQGWPEIDVAEAQGVCDSWVSRYQETRPTVSLTVRAADAAHLEQMLRRVPSDRITVVEANTGLDADLWINGVRVAVTGPQGEGYQVVWECEQVDTVSGAGWDISLWDDAAAVWGI